MTREQVKQVLTNHGLLRHCEKHTGKQFPILCPAHPCPELVDDLLALAPPPPSREALEPLLEEFRRAPHDLHDGLPCPTCKSFMERFVAWAQGRVEKPVWCKHMVYRRAEQGWDGTGWVLEAGAGFEVKENWTVCPICSTPRPR